LKVGYARFFLCLISKPVELSGRGPEGVRCNFFVGNVFMGYPVHRGEMSCLGVCGSLLILDGEYADE